MNRSQPNVPVPGERLAYPQSGVVKRAALLFDRVYLDWPTDHDDVPTELTFNVPKAHEYMDAVGKEWQRRFRERSPKSQYTAEEVAKILGEFYVRLHVDSFRGAGYRVTPVYASQQHFLLDYPPGNALAYQAALESLPEIIEAEVSWDQVVQFRKDTEALRKYRALRLWLEQSLSAESVEQARDIIARKIEDYEWALRKHGLKTATGALSSVLGWKGVTSMAAGAGLGAALGGPVWSAFTAGAVAVSKSLVWVVERMIDRKDIEQSPDAAVALICEAKRLAPKRKNT